MVTAERRDSPPPRPTIPDCNRRVRVESPHNASGSAAGTANGTYLRER